MALQLQLQLQLQLLKAIKNLVIKKMFLRKRFL